MPDAFYTKWPAFLRGLFSFVLPHNCPLCQSSVTDIGLCSDCWHGLRPITAPSCATCGRPLAYALLHNLCAPCLIKPFKASKIRSGYCYDDVSRKLILPFKHANRLDIPPVMAVMIAAPFDALAKTADLVIPVPLHPARYVKRQYNQSAELVRWLCQNRPKGIEFAPHLLVRAKAKPSMAELLKSQHEQNVRRAFQLANPAIKTALAKKNILLIDDVMTTGATLNTCTQTLL